MEAQLDPIFEDQVNSKALPGAAAVALDVEGNILFSKGYGHTISADSSSPKVTPSTPAMIWSCTKLVTCVAMLQLIEQGKADLMDPAAKHYPAIKDIKLLESWNDDGTPNLVEPKNEILLLHLFTHTSGMGYDFLNGDIIKWRVHKGQTPVSYVAESTMDCYTTPLLFEPGTRYEYGPSIDFLGFIIEKLSGMRLDEYVDKHIVQPLGLKNMGSGLSDQQSTDFMVVHMKDADGNLTPTPTRMKEDPEVMAGGHYLYASAEDYADFLLVLLNQGTHPKSKVQILKPETVKEYIFPDMLPKAGCGGEGVGVITSTVPQVSSDGEFLPGISKGWSLGGLINHEDVPNGRKKGSMSWAGLGNCYFWVDPTAGKLGFVVGAYFPFFDKDTLHLADALERAVYGKEMAKDIGAKGSNFNGGSYKL